MKIEAPGLEAETGEGFVAIPAGRYSVQISDCQPKTTKDGSSQYVAWEGTIVGYEVGEEEDAPDYNGRILFWNTSLKQQALWNLKRLLIAAEIPHEGDSFNTEDALGCECDVVVSVEEYEGKNRNRVDDYLPLTGS